MSLHKFMPNKSTSVGHAIYPLPALCGLLLGSALLLTACGDEHEEVKAVDKVEEAAALAKADAPEPVKYEFETTDTTIIDTTDADATVDEITGETAVDDTIDAEALVDGDESTQAQISGDNTDATETEMTNTELATTEDAADVPADEEASTAE